MVGYGPSSTGPGSYLSRTAFEGNVLTTDRASWDYMLRQVTEVPQLQLGKPFPDVYGARLASYRLEPETWANHARRLLALRPELVMLLVPVSLIASVLVLAVRNDVAAAKKVGARGVPMEAGRRMPLASTLARCARRLLRALI